ncbi:hypothetical protein ACFWAR_25420 [Streptomyces sp. NPDC059917]|uniref:hypothetical protein n=1 Tax=Streptomyces sp. NPDC059917 TaxID=3347002 RepID=UPI00365F654A
MKLKRMAVLAATAVVGPTMVAAAPAMAQDKPPVTVPDAAPQSEAQAADATVAAPGAGTSTVPASEQKAAAPRFRMDGPKVSATGVPSAFAPGGAWTPLTVTVDNRGGLPVDGFVPSVGISEYHGIVKAGHIRAEVRGADGSWKPVALRLDRGETVYEIELGPRDVATEQVYSVDVRIQFTADTPAAPLELYVGGEGHDGSGRVTSSFTWFDSRVGEASTGGGGSETPVAVGPKLGLTGLPQGGFKAGGNWTDFSLRVDNSGNAAIDDYQLDLVLFVKNGTFQQDDIKLEVYGPDATGTWGWHPVLSDGSDEVWVHGLATVDIGKNEAFDLKLRMKFGAKTPAHEISLRTTGYNGWGEGSVHSEGPQQTSKVTAADSGQTPLPDGNHPKPDGGTKPTTPPVPTTPGDSTGNGHVGTGGSGGQLAETGTDAATNWALGGAGAALALGAAFVAGAGRHRRPTG